MSDVTSSETGAGPTIEVIVFRHGDEIGRELCESSEDAALVVERWSEQDGVECQVDDLSIHHHPEDILEPTADDAAGDEYPVEQTP